MKRKYSIIILLVLIVFSGCIKNDPVLVTGAVAEFDATALNANTVGLTYPVIGRKPPFERVATTDDSTLRRFSQTIRLRINLVGPQSSQDQTVGYEVFASPIATFSMPATASCAPANFPATCPTAWTQTPAAAAATLTVKDAVPGTHYAPLSGKVTIPANTSFGFIDLQILTTAPTAGEGRFIGLRINETGTIQPSLNYRELGLVIDMR